MCILAAWKVWVYFIFSIMTFVRFWLNISILCVLDPAIIGPKEFHQVSLTEFKEFCVLGLNLYQLTIGYLYLYFYLYLDSQSIISQ